MAGSKLAAALFIGLLAVTGTAVAAGWGSHGMAATSVRPMGIGHMTSTRHEFRGQITGVSQSKWFRIRTNQGRVMRIGVSNATRWSDCNWGAMQAGRHVDVHGVHHNGSWMATSISPWMGNWNDHWGDMSDHMDDLGHMGYGSAR